MRAFYLSLDFPLSPLPAASAMNRSVSPNFCPIMLFLSHSQLADDINQQIAAIEKIC